MISNRMKYTEMSISELSQLAQQGDEAAFKYLQVAKFNRRVKIGDTVLYKKSELEGVVHLKTTGSAALANPERQPTVELQAIGKVLLVNIE